jgi:ketosteroid isomerase-like protein
MVRLALPAVLLSAAAALAGCGGGGASAAPARPAAVQGDAFAAVFRAVEQWRQGWEVRSLEALEPLYRQDQHTVIVHQGRALRGWPAAKTWLRGQLAGASSIHLRLEDGVVTTLGDDSAVFAARMGRDLSDGVITRADEGFVTLTFARAAGGWQIVSEHYSYALGNP